MVEEKLYRKGVSAFIVNSEGRLLLCERADRSGRWQLPQGGIVEGEGLEDALRRELREEIGTDRIDILALLPEPLRYDFPPEVSRDYVGQEHRYFLVRLREGVEIDLALALDREFQSVRWEFADALLDPARCAEFKITVYAKALEAFRKEFPEAFASDTK